MVVFWFMYFCWVHSLEVEFPSPKGKTEVRFLVGPHMSLENAGNQIQFKEVKAIEDDLKQRHPTFFQMVKIGEARIVYGIDEKGKIKSFKIFKKGVKEAIFFEDIDGFSRTGLR